MSSFLPPTEGASKSEASRKSQQHDQDSAKLQEDLIAVNEKNVLYAELLVAGLTRTDETLLDVVAFLEACKERMPEIIDAGSMGLLSEELFALALRVNDAVEATLEAHKNGTVPPPPSSITPNLKQQQQQQQKQQHSVPTSSFSLLDLDDEVSLDFAATAKHAAPPKITLPLAASASAGVANINLSEAHSPTGDSQHNPMLSQKSSTMQPQHNPPPPIKDDDFDSFLASLTKK